MSPFPFSCLGERLRSVSRLHFGLTSEVGPSASLLLRLITFHRFYLWLSDFLPPSLQTSSTFNLLSPSHTFGLLSDLLYSANSGSSVPTLAQTPHRFYRQIQLRTSFFENRHPVRPFFIYTHKCKLHTVLQLHTQFTMADAGVDRQYVDGLRLRNQALEVENSNLTEVNLELNEKIAIGIEKHGPNCFVKRPKPVDWRILRDRGNTRDPKERKKIYKAACKQNNMSSCDQNHGLYFVPPNSDLLEWDPEVADVEVAFQPGKFFNFSALLNYHPDIVFKIARYTMVENTAIYFVARYDLHDPNPPAQGGVDRKSGFSIHYHHGGRVCAINSSPLSKEVLFHLWVSRDWHEIFGTAFYFMNDFYFESLGEFFIFCRNTLRARWQRMHTVHFTFIGSIMETTNPKKSGPRWDRSRWGMHQLGQFLNLRCLEISLDETSNGRIRRKDEPKNMKKPLKISTKTHDNYRMTRDLRKLRGMDNIYQLRGIEHIEFYDNQQYEPKSKVRDQSFVQDLKRQVCAPKSRKNENKAKLENLAPLLRRSKGTPKYIPSRQVKEVLEYIYNSRPRSARPERPQDMAGDDVDSDSDDDDDDEHPRDGPGNETDGDYQGGNDNHNHDDSDDSESDDDAPDQVANARRAASAASRARDFAHRGGENDFDDDDDDVEMGGLEPENDGFESVRSEPLSGIKIEDDGFVLLSSRKTSEVQFIRCVKRPAQTIDLTDLPGLEDRDIALPSIESGQIKKDEKTEDEASAGDIMANIPAFEDRPRAQRDSSPFRDLSLRRGHTEQSSLFVRQSPSSRRSFSSRVAGYRGLARSDRKRLVDEDDEEDDFSPRPGLRRRLSSMAIDEDEIKVEE
ncbi:hypothetical protein O988_07638 [Pseudogymnoascus sp. VKM F-3808]|nr:hypothetical protein O988_07638 [Pseudogymnoascus sp. VKM F-3808]